MNTAIVMLGTNINRNENIERAKERLADFFEIIDESRIITTRSVNRKYKDDFMNQAIKLLTDDTAKETVLHFKHIENELGRSAETNRRAEVPIDIDLIFWNGEQRRSDYDKYQFVKKCVDEIKDNTELTN